MDFLQKNKQGTFLKIFFKTIQLEAKTLVKIRWYRLGFILIMISGRRVELQCRRNEVTCYWRKIFSQILKEQTGRNI